MSLVITSILRAFGQLGDAAILRVFAKSIAITILVFLLAGAALYFGLTMMFAEMGWATGGFAEAAAAALIALVAFWFLFRIIALAVLQFFADEVVLAVEARHYPDAARQARALPFREDLANSLRGIGRTLMFNALALPVALVLVFTAIGPAVVFLLVNAVLLGRELTDMGWLRHKLDPDAACPVQASERLLLGGSIAGLMLVPFVNLIAPVVGAAAATHLVQKKLEMCRE